LIILDELITNYSRFYVDSNNVVKNPSCSFRLLSRSAEKFPEATARSYCSVT